MTEKGIDAATMLEIAELADVGAGTVYNYFESKDELAVCVMERVMHRLAERIDAVDWSKRDPTSLFYVPCQAEHPEDSFFLDCAERRHPLCPSMWLENTAWPLQPNIEAIQPDVQSSRVDEVLLILDLHFAPFWGALPTSAPWAPRRRHTIVVGPVAAAVANAARPPSLGGARSDFLDFSAGTEWRCSGL